MDKNKVIEAAAKLVAKGAYDKAIKEYQKVLEADPRDVRVLQKMGELYQKKNDNAQAAHYFTKVAESYSADGFFLKAVALYKQVLRLNPALMEVNLKLAELHQQLGLMSEAMTYYQGVANHHDKAGDVRASLDTLKKMVDLDPENVGSRVKLADLYARQSMNKEALAEFKRAADHLKRAGRSEEYLRVAERVAALEPESVALNRELAVGYLRANDPKRALARLQVCFKADARDTETLQLLAQAFQGLGQTAKTVSVYKELAKVYAEHGQTAKADGVWASIRELDPDDADARAQRQHPVAAAPAPATSIPAGAPAPAPVPAAATAAPVALGREQLVKVLTETDVYVKYGLHEKALEHLRKVFSVDPENLDAHEKAYQIYVAAGHPAQAADQLLNVLRLCTRNAEVRRAQPYLAELLRTQPDHPEVPAFLSVLQADAAGAGEDEAVAEDAILVVSNDEGDVVVGEPPPDALGHLTMDDLALMAATRAASAEAFVEEPEPPRARSPASGSPAHGGYALGGDESYPSQGEDEPLVDGDDAAVFALAQESADQDADGVLAEEPEAHGDETQVLVTGDYDELTDDDPLVVEDEQVVMEAEEAIPAPPVRAAPAAPPPTARPAPSRPVPVASFPAANPSHAAKPAPVAKPAPAAAKAAPPAPAAKAGQAPKPAPVAAPAPPAAEEPAGEELDEAEFFLEQGLLEEAREILETVSIAFPGHRRGAQLLARLEALESGGEAAAPAEETDAFDLAQELAGDFNALGDASPQTPEEDFQYSVEEVFNEFKKGLEKVVKPEDVDTHYDLGIAYKEMGLLDDAISEFLVAQKGCLGKKKEVDCLTMVGLLQRDRGDHAAAVAAFKEALSSEHAAGEPHKALLFELGSTYEAMGSAGKALFHFQKVAQLDKAYREVEALVERLRAQTSPEPDDLPKRPAPGSAPAVLSTTRPGASPTTRKVGYV